MAICKTGAARQRHCRPIRSRIFTSFVRRIVATGVTDTQCGFKGFCRELARFLFSRSRIDGFAFDVEVIYIAFKHNLDVKRLPVNLVSNSPSTVKLLRDSCRMVRDVVRIKYNHIRGVYD